MNQRTEKEKQDNWQLLFDGSTPSKHWRGFQSEEFPAGWIVDNGTLHRADHAGDIITKEQFQDFELFSEDWEKRVAGAKFADWPRYGREPKGHIALQDHQNPVWYRNIKLRRL